MKSALRLKQEEFTVAIAKLILAARYPGLIDYINRGIEVCDESKGITLSFGDAYRDPRVFGEVGTYKGYGQERSCHKSRLAVDFNTLKASDHETLHDIWDGLGGSKRIASDANHFSFEWQGMR